MLDLDVWPGCVAMDCWKPTTSYMLVGEGRISGHAPSFCSVQITDGRAVLMFVFPYLIIKWCCTFTGMWKGLPVAVKVMIVHVGQEETSKRQMLEATISTRWAHQDIGAHHSGPGIKKTGHHDRSQKGDSCG